MYGSAWSADHHGITLAELPGVAFSAFYWVLEVLVEPSLSRQSPDSFPP
jgi:hypothetical protein